MMMISVNAEHLSAALSRVVRFTSESQADPDYFHRVHFKVDYGVLTVEATDRFVAGRFLLRTDGEFLLDSVSLSKDAVWALRAFLDLNQANSGPAVSLDTVGMSEDILRLDVTRADGVMLRLKGVPPDVRLSNAIDTVLDAAKPSLEGDVETALNLDMLSRFHEVWNRARVLSPSGPGVPVRVEAGYTDDSGLPDPVAFIGCVMPMNSWPGRRS